jgi:ADP-glucose pyrophosphorylase
MQDGVLTFISAASDGPQLLPLTAEQPTANLPFGGVFRLIDFALSNILNSQFRRIYVVTGAHSDRVNSHIQTTWRHLSAGFRWDCGEDLICLPGAPDLRQVSEIVRNQGAEYVLIVSADQVYQMDYRKLLRAHIVSRAEVTSPAKGIYIFSRNSLLRQQVLDLSQYAITNAGFSGYLRTIETLDDYYAANMDLLSGRVGFDPYSDQKLLQVSRFASHSKIALGARLNSCRVSGSLISPGVRIDPGAVVEDSVILPGSHIGAAAKVRNSIVCENSIVPVGVQVGTESRLSVFAAVRESESPVRQIRRRCARVATKCAAGR